MQRINIPSQRGDSVVLLPDASGAVSQYRVGKVVNVHGQLDLRPLQQDSTTYIANGLVPVKKDNDNLLIYGTSQSEDNSYWDFKLVVENRESGLTFAKLSLVDSATNEEIRKIEGFVTDTDYENIKSVSSHDDNVINIHTSDGIEQVNLGKIHLLVVDCGYLEPHGLGYKTFRDQDRVFVYQDLDLSKAEKFGDSPFDQNVFGNTPIATLPTSRLASRFNPTAAKTLDPISTSGNVQPRMDLGR
jgi:hypothetical protein